MSDRAYLELWDLTKSYPSRQGEAVIVKNISFKFRKGEFVTIIGHSGCGKSTILMMVAGLSTVTSGGIVLAGKELNGPGPDRGVVFQSPSLLPWMSAFRKRHARGGSGIPHGRTSRAATYRRILPESRRTRRLDA